MQKKYVQEWGYRKIESVFVGLDSDYQKLPDICLTQEDPQFFFNASIIDATADIVSGYKINTAFYEALGATGITSLKKTCDYINARYPTVPLILDAKRADIASTNNGYVSFAFEYLQCDAITVSPYVGKEALLPFLDCKEKGIIVLCKTSNPGSSEFQNLSTDGAPIYLHVARSVAQSWNEQRNCLLVVGATYPTELAEIRSVASDIPFLVPGIGTQGGDIGETIRHGKTVHGNGLLLCASRSIIFADHGDSFATFARNQTQTYKDIIVQHV